VLVAEEGARKTASTHRISGGQDNRLFHFAPGPARPAPRRRGETTTVTSAAPHYLIADGSAEGAAHPGSDAWQRGQEGTEAGGTLPSPPAALRSGIHPSGAPRHDHGSHSPGMRSATIMDMAMLTAAAVCPHPPLLIPPSVRPASDPLPRCARFRDASRCAVHALAAASPASSGGRRRAARPRVRRPRRPARSVEFGVPVTVWDGEPVACRSRSPSAGVCSPGVSSPGRKRRGTGRGAAWRRSDAAGVPPMTPQAGRGDREGRPGSPCWPWAMLLRGGPAHMRAPPTPGQYTTTMWSSALRRRGLPAGSGGRPALDGELMVAGRAAWQVPRWLGRAARGCAVRLRCMASPTASRT